VDDLLNRHDLTDEEWVRLVPLMPAQPRQGRRWNDHRTVINGILFRTRTGCPWRDVPGAFGNWKTVSGRHRRWSLDGTWAKILDVLRAGCDQAEGRDWAVSADSTDSDLGGSSIDDAFTSVGASTAGNVWAVGHYFDGSRDQTMAFHCC
jgi:transposase